MSLVKISLNNINTNFKSLNNINLYQIQKKVMFFDKKYIKNI